MPAAPIPDDTDSLTYATMGTNKDNPTATVYGNFKCPYTQEFVRGGYLEAVLNEYVTSGDLNLRFRALAYQPPGTTSHGTSDVYISESDPHISEAAMGVWDVSPDDYWEFFNYMFSDLISGSVSFSEMASRMQSSDVDDISTIIEHAESGKYMDAVRQSRYPAGEYGVSFTPTLVMNGETTAPHHDVDELLNWLSHHISKSSDTTSDETNSDTSSEDSTKDSSSTDSTSDEDSSSTDSTSDEDSSSTDSTSDEDSSSTDSTSDGASGQSIDSSESEDMSTSGNEYICSSNSSTDQSSSSLDESSSVKEEWTWVAV